jgi:hypothetical protein
LGDDDLVLLNSVAHSDHPAFAERRTGLRAVLSEIAG